MRLVGKTYDMERSPKEQDPTAIFCISKTNTDLPTNDETGEPVLKCRYIVALIGFAIYVILNVQRLNMNISIVAMVNHTVYHRNTTVTATHSCPSNIINTSISAESPKRYGEFEWSPEVQGFILGSSFVGYGIAHIPGGILSETVGCRMVLILGTAVASVSTFVTPFAARIHVYLLIADQFVRGFAQGAIPPALSIMMANWFPIPERGILSCLVLSGLCMGGLLGGVVSGYLADTTFLEGWPSVFYICGLFGILLSIFAFFFFFESPGDHPRISQTEFLFITTQQEAKLLKKRPSVPWKEIFCSMPIHALLFAFCGHIWMTTHFMVIHPTYMDTILHYSIEKNGTLTSITFAGQLVFLALASWISGVLLRKKMADVDTLRKFWAFLSCLCYSLGLLGIYLAGCNVTACVIITVVSISVIGVAYAGCIIVPNDMSPTFAGSVMGFMCTVGNISGIILPLLVGFLTENMQTIEQWNKVFAISVGVVMSSSVIFTFFGSANVQPWNFSESEEINSKL